MPESHKAERRRQLKQNVAAGIGDENGRIPPRVKAEAQMARCSECQCELKITKTNTELKLHAENKHGKTIDICFPEAETISAEMRQSVGKKGKDADAGSSKGKKANKEDLDALLLAGMNGGAGAKKKGKK